MKLKRSITWLIILALLVILGVGIWWQFFYDPYRPTAYVGYSTPYEVEHDKDYIDFPSYVMEVDLLGGEVVDTFPLSKGVPHVKSVAVDPERELLYAAGKGLVRHPERGRMPSKGIEVYDLKTKELKKTIRFPSPKTGEDREVRIKKIRFNPSHNYLFIDKPLYNEEVNEQENKPTWLFDVTTGKVKPYGSKGFGSLHFLSPSGNYIYGFGGFSLGPSRWVYDLNKDKLVEHFKGENNLLEAGGWQPDPKGKFEEEPYTLDYPEIWGTGKEGEVIEFYNREILEKIGELQLERKGEHIYRASPPRQPDAVNKTERYTVSRVWMKTDETDGYAVPFLKVIDMKEMKLVNTIRLGEPGEIRGMTYVDVY